MRILTFILDEPFTSFCEGIIWRKFCCTLFKLNSAELKLDKPDYVDLFDPFKYPEINRPFVDVIPEPILSRQLANVAISCMQYLHRWDSNTPPTRDHFLASWTTKSKQSPWLWRRRMRATSMARRQRIWNLRLSSQVFYSEMIQSEDFLFLFFTSNGYSTHGLSTSSTTLSAKPWSLTSSPGRSQNHSSLHKHLFFSLVA